MEISGGLQIPIVIIPAADGRENYDENFGEAGMLRKMGATNVTVLHTSDRNVANTEEFVKPLLDAKLVWFSGGRQWRLVDAYKNTLTEKMLWKVLEKGGTIGGSSAGATIQGSFLVRGDTKNNQWRIWSGLGLISRCGPLGVSISLHQCNIPTLPYGFKIRNACV